MTQYDVQVIKMAIAKENKELASKVSFEVVKDIAPRELLLFDDYKEKFMKNPDAFSDKDRKKREKALGFALPDGTAQIVTSFVLPVALNAINKYISKKMGDKLNKDQLSSMRVEAYNNAISLGMDKDKAELMADALVGKMMRLSEAK
jgi:hypothetical protein